MALALHEKLVIIPFMPQDEKLSTALEFDSMLNEALNIAQTHIMIIGEHGWFRLLEFVNDYVKKVPDEIKK
jgi:hypothetical protein